MAQTTPFLVATGLGFDEPAESVGYTPARIQAFAVFRKLWVASTKAGASARLLSMLSAKPSGQAALDNTWRAGAFGRGWLQQELQAAGFAT